MIKVCFNIGFTYSFTDATLIEVIEMLRNIDHIICCPIELQVIEYFLIGYRRQEARGFGTIINQPENTDDTHHQGDGSRCRIYDPLRPADFPDRYGCPAGGLVGNAVL